jgi:chemotaxis protein CheC
MQAILSDGQRHVLRTIFDRGAEGASQVLSKWLSEEVRLVISEVELIELARTAELLGPEDSLVAACTMGLTGRLTGLILLIFEDRSGFALVDLLTRQPIGTTMEWGEFEKSAATETTNIIGCAYVNALATHLPGIASGASDQSDEAETDGGELVPTPPMFVQEFAGSLLQFALMDQALELDQLLLIHSQFESGRPGLNLDWTLLFIPSRVSLRTLALSLARLESHATNPNERK